MRMISCDFATLLSVSAVIVFRYRVRIAAERRLLLCAKLIGDPLQVRTICPTEVDQLRDSTRLHPTCLPPIGRPTKRTGILLNG